jgi:hypothetical protein
MAFELLEPKTVEIKTLRKGLKVYTISMFPAVAGREIVAKYPLTAMPKLGDYSVNEETMLKLMAYVAVEIAPGNMQRLSTRALIDSHVPDWEALMYLEYEMLKYNTSFFGNGEVFTFCESLVKKFLASISPILTDSSVQLLEQIKQRLRNSKPNTP